MSDLQQQMVQVAYGRDRGHFGLVDLYAVLLFQRDHDIEDVRRLRAEILLQAVDPRSRGGDPIPNRQCG